METKNFTIYFTSDLHGYIYPTDYRSREERDIGLFKCASQFRKDGNTLIIDGGDILQGSPLGAYCHDTLGDASRFAEMMNRCGYDYVTLGNHDFNYGMAYLDSYLNALHARCVCENVRWDGAGVRFPARIHTLENGLRIGIVGIVTDYVNIWERPEHLSGVTVNDPIPAARAALETLKDQVDVTLCIYHGGFERDLATGRVLSSTHENVAYRLCQELDFDILLTGHQHMTVHGQTVCGTFVVQPTDRGQEFPRIDAAVSGKEKRFTSETVHAGGVCRREWLAEFAEMEHGAQGWLDQVVGHLPRPLLPDTPLRMAAEGSGLPDLFNAVQLWASGAQLSAASLANDVAGLPQGTVTGWLVVAYLALLCTCLSYVLQNTALTRLSSYTVSLLQCTQPILTAACSYLLLGGEAVGDRTGGSGAYRGLRGAGKLAERPKTNRIRIRGRSFLNVLLSSYKETFTVEIGRFLTIVMCDAG